MKNNMHTNKGQIIIAIAGAVSAVLASIFTAWGTAGSRVNEIDTKVQVVIERENNHYLELNKKMKYICKRCKKETGILYGSLCEKCEFANSEMVKVVKSL